MNAAAGRVPAGLLWFMAALLLAAFDFGSDAAFSLLAIVAGVLALVGLVRGGWLKPSTWIAPRDAVCHEVFDAIDRDLDERYGRHGERGDQ